MNKLVFGLVVFLVVIELLGIAEARLIQAAIISFYAIALGLNWLFGNKPGRDHIIGGLALILGPIFIIAIGTDIFYSLRLISPEHALLACLLLVLALVYGPRLLKRNKR